MTRRIDIVEVGPRDGLQNDPANLTVAQKLEFIARLEAAGVRRMESGSFVSPKAVPKMADSPAVFAGLDRTKPTRHIALALNETGMRRAIEAKADEINFVLVAGEGFGRRNQGMSPQESADMLAKCAPLAHEAGIPLSATISVAFGDPYDGDVDIAVVGNLAAQAQRAGVGELALGDTIGAATPWEVRKRIDRVRIEAPDVFLRMHFHDTRGAALANVFAAVEAGVDVIDASCGGIGGCPFAPAATGNVATEDVVWMLERAGFETGLDLAKLIETAKWLETVLGHKVESALSRAGGVSAVYVVSAIFVFPARGQDARKGFVRLEAQMQVAGLTVDPLAIAALVGFGTLLLVMISITVWILRQAGKSAGEK